MKPYEGLDRFLGEPNIELRGRVSPRELIRVCREEAHAMFIPMSHRAEDRRNMEVSFPSKLADCTAAGLPLLIDGPDYCSAVRWARENPGVAEVVTLESVDALAEALGRLQESDTRLRLAEQAIRRGQEYFAHERAVSTFMTAVSGPHE